MRASMLSRIAESREMLYVIKVIRSDGCWIAPNLGPKSLRSSCKLRPAKGAFAIASCVKGGPSCMD